MKGQVREVRHFLRMRRVFGFGCRAMKLSPYYLWRKSKAQAWERGWRPLLGVRRVEGVA